MSIKLHRSRSARLSEEDLLPGDHIYVKRSGRFYKHHGIYMGDGKVIHVSGSVREKVSPEVRESDLSLFLKGKSPKKNEIPYEAPRIRNNPYCEKVASRRKLFHGIEQLRAFCRILCNREKEKHAGQENRGRIEYRRGRDCHLSIDQECISPINRIHCE